MLKRKQSVDGTCSCTFEENIYVVVVPPDFSTILQQTVCDFLKCKGGFNDCAFTKISAPIYYIFIIFQVVSCKIYPTKVS